MYIRCTVMHCSVSDVNSSNFTSLTVSDASLQQISVDSSSSNENKNWQCYLKILKTLILSITRRTDKPAIEVLGCTPKCRIGCKIHKIVGSFKSHSVALFKRNMYSDELWISTFKYTTTEQYFLKLHIIIF